MQLEVLKYKKSLIWRDLVQVAPSCSVLFIRGYFSNFDKKVKDFTLLTYETTINTKMSRI